MSESFAIDCILDGSLPAKERVSSLAVHGEKIYLGHPTGGLSIFRLPPSSASFTEDSPAPEASSSSSSSSSAPSPKARLISTHPTFHANGKQVLNLRIVPSLSLIFSSCTDGVLHCNSLATLESVKIPTPIRNNAPKGITAFEVQTSVVAWPRDDEEASKKAGPSATRGGSRFGARQPGTGGTLPRNSSAASVISSTGKARPLSSFIRQDSNRSVAAPKPNLRLVTVLVVALRRKVIVVRWVDGQPWDWRELLSNHTPRSIAFAPPESASTDGDATRNPSSNVFLSYGTATDFGILEIPPAFKSSAAKSQHLDFAADEKRDFPRDESTGTWKKVKDLTVPEYAGSQAEAGGTSSRAQSPAPSSSDHHSLKGLSEPPSSAKAAVAQTGGGGYLGLGGLGGYIGLGGRSKPPVIRAVPRSTAAGKVVGEGSDSSGNMEDELVVLRDTNAVFLSFKTGNPTRRRGIEWPASVDDVALLPSQHLCTALPPTSQQVKPSIQLRSLRSLDVIQTVTLPPEPATPPTAAKGKASQATTSYSISTLFAPPATTSSTSTSSPLYLVLTPNNSTEAVRLYKLTARPWRARLKEMLRTKQWERAVELVRTGLTDGELEAEGNEAGKEPSTGSQIRKRLLLPLLSLLALDRFMSGCASSVKKQMAAANASFEAAVDLWNELNINPAKVLCIFPERIAGNGLSRPSKDWVQIWGEDLTQEGFDLRNFRWQGHDSRQGSGFKLDASADSSPFASLTSPKPVRAVSSTGGTKLSQIFGGRPIAAATAVDTSRSSSPAQKSDAGAAEVNKTTGKATSDSPAAVAPSSSDGSGVQQSADSQIDSSHRPSIVQDDATAPVESAEEAALTSRPALEALGRFLADRRRIFKPILETRPKVSPSPDSTMLSLPSIPLPDMTLEDLTTLARVVDTALFKTFLETKPGLVGPLCRIENWCEVTEVEELLEAKGKSSELISIYGGKNMHDKALKLLKKFADEEDDEEEKVGPTIRYLQSLGPEHIKVILENAKWVLQEDRKRGMEIFTADTGKVSSLPRLEIINLLWSFDQDLCAEYLEHVIGEVKEADPEVHEKLALIYLSRVKKQQKAGGVASEQKLKDEERLLQFLIDSEQYRPERILAQVPFNALWQVRAVLLGRMGQHRGALAIYVERIGGDIGEQKAEEYCQNVYAKAKDDEERNIFLTLLKLHLQPALDKLQGSDDEDNQSTSPDGKEAASITPHELDPALRLLSRHPSSLDLSSVLHLLPPLLTLSSLSTYLSKALQSTHRTHHNHRVLAQITKERHLQLEEKITLSKRKKVLIPPGRTCGVCGKRLGVSVLSVDVRSGEVVHYGCRVGQQQRQQQGQGLREQ